MPAAVPTLAARWLIPRLPDFATQHPDVVVHIETCTRPFMFADAQVAAALYVGMPVQIAQWAGTTLVELMLETVVQVCSPRLLSGKAALPLLQQSTWPEGWRQWFAAAGLEYTSASLASLASLAGPRYELFSMTTAAACGMGVALVPSLLIEAEPARGELVIANPLPMPGDRYYYWITPQGTSVWPVVTTFLLWSQRRASLAAHSLIDQV